MGQSIFHGQKTYDVSWHLTVFADSPEEAVIQAVKTQRDPESWATYFTVTPIAPPAAEPVQEKDYMETLVKAGLLEE